MTLQQLTYFLAAVEHRSFSAAAEALFMAQPSLSDQVRRLEAELGVTLFARSGRGLELKIEVEYVTAALELAARGLGDTVSSRQMIRARGLARRLAAVGFDPPLYDAFAFITRRSAHLSPATREFM